SPSARPVITPNTSAKRIRKYSGVPFQRASQPCGCESFAVGFFLDNGHSPSVITDQFFQLSRTPSSPSKPQTSFICLFLGLVGVLGGSINSEPQNLRRAHSISTAAPHFNSECRGDQKLIIWVY